MSEAWDDAELPEPDDTLEDDGDAWDEEDDADDSDAGDDED